MKSQFKYLLLLAMLLFVFIPGSVFAHDGHSGNHSFLSGVYHPIFGFDHLLAMVAIGLWAAQMGGKATWIVPLSFVSLMAIGGTFGIMGITLPYVENVILVSVVVLGLLIAFATKAPIYISIIIAGFFAFYHGLAHGSEMSAGNTAIPYCLGFILATAALHAIGVFSGLSLKQWSHTKSFRFTGASIAICGICLFAF